MLQHSTYYRITLVHKHATHTTRQSHTILYTIYTIHSAHNLSHAPPQTMYTTCMQLISHTTHKLCSSHTCSTPHVLHALHTSTRATWSAAHTPHIMYPMSPALHGVVAPKRSHSCAVCVGPQSSGDPASIAGVPGLAWWIREAGTAPLSACCCPALGFCQQTLSWPASPSSFPPAQLQPCWTWVQIQICCPLERRRETWPERGKAQQQQAARAPGAERPGPTLPGPWVGTGPACV